MVVLFVAFKQNYKTINRQSGPKSTKATDVTFEPVSENMIKVTEHSFWYLWFIHLFL